MSGNFTYTDVESMPVYERYHFVKLVKDVLDERRRAEEQAARGSGDHGHMPNIVPRR
jgi:hypothetical protein